ncbi:ATP-binding protein [Streptomyces sp. NPDC060064]|uniref:ATP-binding protein n=1 Tax=Streptomyces sp. NPDC060064 TaxID=3347049 RepID=UPI00367BCFB3
MIRPLFCHAVPLSRSRPTSRTARRPYPYSYLSDSAALIVAELAANAVTHARVPGRDFELRLALCPTTLRIEVSDARGDREPAPKPPTPDSETGRGLLLVDALSTDWGVADRVIGKTVWAELPLGQRKVVLRAGLKRRHGGCEGNWVCQEAGRTHCYP